MAKVKPRQYRPVLSLGQPGSALGMLSEPWGVAVNERDEIAVTDKGNNRVQLFSSDRTYLKSDRLEERVINRDNLTMLMGYFKEQEYFCGGQL